MIQVNELRIGNKIMYGAVMVTVYGVVTQERKSIIWYDDEAGFYLEEREADPIPLSPALLKQCGFEGDYHGNGSELVFRKKWEGFNIDLWQGAAPPFDYWAIPYSPTSLYFLHQLQNLFFAMTGEELKIEL